MNDILALMHPFSKSRVEEGEKICTQHGNECIYIAGPNRLNTVVTQWPDGQFCLKHVNDLRMSPLAWLENKPVYPNDRLWWIPQKRFVTVISHTNEFFSDTGGVFKIKEFEHYVLFETVTLCAPVEATVQGDIKYLAYRNTATGVLVFYSPDWSVNNSLYTRMPMFDVYERDFIDVKV